MKIGILSDTHGDLDSKIFSYFKNVDEIWHAGDIGTIDVLEKLEKFKPTKAVYGNIDNHHIRAATKEYEFFSIQSLTFLMLHIAGKPYKYNNRAHELIKKYKPNVLVCGHSHILLVQQDKLLNTLWINPGACGIKGFHKNKTIVRFEIIQGKIKKFEAIDMGSRSNLQNI